MICSINGEYPTNHQTATRLINEATETEAEIEFEYYPAKTVSNSNSSETSAYPSLSLAHGLKAIVPTFSYLMLFQLVYHPTRLPSTSSPAPCTCHPAMIHLPHIAVPSCQVTRNFTAHRTTCTRAAAVSGKFA